MQNKNNSSDSKAARVSSSATPAASTTTTLQQEVNALSHLQLGDNASLHVGNVKVVGQKIVYKGQAELPPLPETLQQAAQQCQHANHLEQALHFYIAPEMNPFLGSEQRFDLVKEVEQFLEHPQQRLLLILGDSGEGKSLFTQQLEKDQWENYKPGQRIPLRIELKQFSGAEVKQCLVKIFAALGYPESALPALYQHHPFLFIFDGYDEIGGRTYFNLYQANHLELWDAKVIITCRTQALSGDHAALFAPNQNPNAWREIYLAPFSEAAIKQYLKKYTVEHPEATQLPQYVEKNPTILPLLSNPFILNLFAQAFPQLAPRLMADRMTALTRHEIYSAFMQQWFAREEQFLAYKIGLPAGRDAKQEFRCFAEQLALSLFQAKQIEITYSPPVDANGAANNPWHAFFNHDDEHTIQCRRACPLRRVGDYHYSFVHKSFLEYFVAEALWTAILSLPNTTEQLNTHLWSEEPAILNFLTERLNTVPDKAAHIEQLLTVVKSSRNNAASSRMAANALTLLNAARVAFSGMDLQGVQISGADLESAILYQTNLSYADLRSVNLRNAYLTEANLSHSQMEGVRFGEWPYLQHKINCCAYSPDGRWLAVASEDKIHLWDTATGESMRVLEGHTDKVTNVSFSGDSQRLASGSNDKTVRLWDVVNGTLLHTLTLKEEHTGDVVMSVSFNPDGQCLASSKSAHSRHAVQIWNALYHRYESTTQVRTVVRVWDVASGTVVHNLELRERERSTESVDSTESVHSASFSPDGQRLALASVNRWDRWQDTELECDRGAIVYFRKGLVEVRDDVVQVWDAVSGTLLHILRGHKQSVTSVNFSPNSQRLASGSEDNTVRIWDVVSGILLHTLQGHTDTVYNVSWSPDGQRLASGSEDNTVRVWDVVSGVLLHTLQGHINPMCSISWSPDGQRLVCGSDDNTVWLWNVASGMLLQTPQGHTGKVINLSFSRDGQRLASGSYDDTVRLWDTVSGTLLHTLKMHKSANSKLNRLDSIERVRFSSDGQQLVSISRTTVCRWEVGSGRLLHDHSINGRGYGAKLSPDGQWLALIDFFSNVVLYDMVNFSQPRTLKGHTRSVYNISFSPDSQRLASGSGDYTMRLWDTASGSCLHNILHGGNISITWSSDSQRLASASSLDSIDNIVWLCDAHSGESLHTLKGHTDKITSIRWSPDGQRLASGSEDKTVRLWNAMSGKLLHTLRGHTHAVMRVRWSPDGQQLASTSKDNTVRLWDVRTRQCLQILPLEHVVFASNGYVASARDNSVECWQPVSTPTGLCWQLLWSKPRATLVAQNAQIAGAIGLSPNNQRLLQQRGATSEPASEPKPAASLSGKSPQALFKPATSSKPFVKSKALGKQTKQEDKSTRKPLYQSSQASFKPATSSRPSVQSKALGKQTKQEDKSTRKPLYQPPQTLFKPAVSSSKPPTQSKAAKQPKQENKSTRKPLYQPPQALFKPTTSSSKPSAQFKRSVRMNNNDTTQLTLEANAKLKSGNLEVTGVEWQHAKQTKQRFFREKKALPPSAADKQLLGKIEGVIATLYHPAAFLSFQEQAETYLQPFREHLLKPTEKQQLNAYLADQTLLAQAKQLIETLYPDAEDEATRLQTLHELYQSFSKSHLTAEEKQALEEYLTTYQSMLPSEPTCSTQLH